MSENQECKHEYIWTQTGEECKHCGLLRSTIEDTKTKPVDDGFQRDEKGNILSPFMEEIVMGQPLPPLPNPQTMKAEIPDAVFTEIFKATGGKSAIILTFSDPIVTNPFTIRDFKIAVANIRLENVNSALSIVLQALLGRLGGNLNIRKRGDEPPQPTAL